MNHFTYSLIFTRSDNGQIMSLYVTEINGCYVLS